MTVPARPVFASLLALGLTLGAGNAQAQAWFTREACTVTGPVIDPAVIDAARMARIAEASAGIENGVGRLWRITAPGGAVSHLWGTLHSNDPLILDLPDALRDVLARARTVATEIDTVMKTRGEIEAWYAGGTAWRNAPVPARRYALDLRANEYMLARLASQGHDADVFDWLTPSGLAEIVMADPCNDFAEGVLPIQDDRIHLLGLDAGARIVGLEPKEAFARKLDTGDGALADAIIESYAALLGPDNIRAERRTAFAFYLEGRIGDFIAWDRIDALEFFGPERGAELWDRMHGYLVEERNRGFRAPAIELLNQGGAVIAVGAFHLPGRAGLVALFREAGFTVERVRTEGEAP